VSSPAALLGEHLTKRFGEVRAVRDVSLRVMPGEVVGLIGPNGAGKSTLLSLLAGLMAPDEGTAFIEGARAHSEAGQARAQLGFLAGDTALYGRLKVQELLRFFGPLYGLEGARLAERVALVLAELRLEELAGRRCDALSAGQVQRVNLARALLHEPRVLILDEPTTALDVSSQRFVLSAIRRAKERGRAVLFSSHVMGEVEEVADRVVLLERGALRAEGTLAQLQEKAGGQGLSALFGVDEEEAP
jgi:sodium transport system ATP-binding protein